MRKPYYVRKFNSRERSNSAQLKLKDGSRVAVMGGGPAGSLFSYFLLDLAEKADLQLHVDIYEPLVPGFKQPGMTKLFVREYYVGQEEIERHLGLHTIHFFLLDLPGLDFAAIVPKGDHVTVCLLGNEPTNEVFERFLYTQELIDCRPPGWQPEAFVCHCTPRINLTGSFHPYADRMVFLGDSEVSRLYKDGIGAAYRAAKCAVLTAIFHGIGETDFESHYWRMCRRMENDNRVGKFIFTTVRLIKPWRFAMRGVVKMVINEQSKEADQRWMSGIMWDMFTGSAPYRDIFIRFFNPAFWSRFLWHVASSPLLWRPEWKQAL